MTAPHDVRRLTVSPDETGERADRFLGRRLELSRTRVQRLMEEGRVSVASPGGSPRPVRKSEVVEAGWEFRVEIPAAAATELAAEALPLDLVYEDEHLAVVDKAAGMVVHPAPGHRSGTMVNALLYHLEDLSGVGGRLRPGIVHRLDRDTSGLMVVAKTDAAHTGLAEALRRRKIRRIYQAAVWGRMPESPLTIDAPIARDPRNRKRMAVVEGGRRAVTRLRVREEWLAAQLLEVALETGRTHQIRVHTAHVGHPVVGDATYGRGGARGISGAARSWAERFDRRVPRQFLHAWRLAFDHPVSGERMRFQRDLPADLARAAEWARAQ